MTRLFELVARPFRGAAAVDSEIETHLSLQMEELIRSGMDADAARAETLRRFGDIDVYRRALMKIDGTTRRRRRWHGWIADFGQDVGLALRSLGRSRMFAAGVIATLALGIGVNVTMIGLVDRLLFQAPAHVVDPGSVVRYTLTQTDPSFGSFTNQGVTYKELGIQRQSSALVALAAYYPGEVSYGRGEGARPLRASLTSTNYFALLGVRPVLGRFYDEADDPIGGGQPLAVISYRLWQREFNGDRDVLDRSLWLGSRQYRVIGVAPRHFAGIDLDAVDTWLPLNTGIREYLGASDEWRDTWNWQWVRLIGRLAPGKTRQQASAEATTRYRAATADDPERKDDRGVVTFQPLIAARGVDETQTPLIATLLAAVSVLVLVISCANVANLMLARGIARRREIAVRLALGSGRGRLVRTLALETVVLAAAAAIAGLAVAAGGGVLVRSVLLPGIDFIEPPVDARLLAVTALAALAAGLLAGLGPALRLSRADLTADLKAAGSPQGSAGRDHLRLRTGLLATQAVLAAMMLLCAGLFYKSLATVGSVDFGFRPEGLITANIDLGVAGYTRPQQHAFYDAALARIEQTPGVAHAALMTANPFWTRQGTSVRLPGRDSTPRLKSGGPYYSAVTPSYFQALGVQLVRGRLFTDQDGTGAPRVMVVNETLAKTFWPDEDAIGRCIFVGRGSAVCREVVGVTRDASSESLEPTAVLAYYLPLAQVDSLASDRYLAIRAAGDPAALIPSIRRLLQTMAPNLPVAEVRLMQEQIEPLVRPWRLGAILFTIMAGVALLVALVGLYSVLAFLVEQRRQEFGIRSALGARSGDVARMVIVQGQRVVAVGVIVGLGLSLVAIRFLVPPELTKQVLFQTSPTDPVVLVTVAALLTATSFAGSVLPALRAGRVEPMEALRVD